MRWTKIKSLYIFLFFCSYCVTSFSAATPALLQQATLAPMLAQITPAIVNIAVEKEPSSSADQSNLKNIAVGSGVVFDAKRGLIVTNAHVVKDQRVMLITFKDGHRDRGELVAKDEGFDLAIVRVQNKNLTDIQFADSDQLKVGDFVAAIGSPFGLTQTVTSGMVSALNRDEPQLEGFQNFIQTDAPINPGNSGGALVNMQGQLIGINTAIFSTSGGNNGIGFAIPSNMVKAVIKQLLEHGKVSPGVLGVLVQNITPPLASALNLKDTKGVLVTDVLPFTPAQKAGLQAQDIILSINNNPIYSAQQLRNMLGLMSPGTSLSIILQRNFISKTMNATVADPKSLNHQYSAFLAGLELQDFEQLQPDGSLLKGALVVFVEDTSNAALSGLLAGDVIISANLHPTSSIAELQKIAAKKSEQLLLKVARGRGKLFIVIQ